MQSSKPGTTPSRWPYLVIAYLCVGLAGVGVVLPGVPTTPFLLVAAWAAGRGSARLHRWLHEHRHFGPLLHHWERERAVPTRAKWLTVVLLAVSWAIMAWRTDGPLVPIVTGALFAGVTLFVVTRPAPRAAYQRPPREVRRPDGS